MPAPITLYSNTSVGHHVIQIGAVRAGVIYSQVADWDGLPPTPDTRQLRVLVTFDDAAELLIAANELGIPPESQTETSGGFFLQWELPRDQIHLVDPLENLQAEGQVGETKR